MRQTPFASPSSRRSFLQVSGAATAAMALRVVTEPMLARAQVEIVPKDAVMIDANENPLGPCTEARQAIADITPQGGRYLLGMPDELATVFAQAEGLKPEYVKIYPGSSGPLHYTVMAFTSPRATYVTADPGFEAGMFAADCAGARVVKVPLTKTYAHDVRAMLAAAPDAGVFYVCTPNNPTGTLTSHSDVEYLLENKPKNSILLVDEAYIHFADTTSALDLVKANKDVIVLRTFSKVYGMAGLRCGLAIGRPDLLEKVDKYSGWNSMPITAVAAAMASLKHTRLVPERKRINTENRQRTFEWLDQHGYSYIPSQTNFFMVDTKRPAKEVIAAMRQQNVFIGRVWPALPTHVRVTIGTHEEMERFQAAFQNVMQGKVSATVGEPPRLRRHLDGVRVPSHSELA
jgi:histidinol-phosphate aminotransferase